MRQREDLRGARDKLLAEHAGMKVDLFYARAEGAVRFEAVT